MYSSIVRGRSRSAKGMSGMIIQYYRNKDRNCARNFLSLVKILKTIVMLFALVGDKRDRARPELEGICPYCRQKVIAKCGNLRIHHWAHYNNRRKCDSWWEPETEWHWTWKNEFPAEWQEVVLTDEMSGERHVADVQTEHGIVIEFQHSHIQQAERISREQFYKSMIWVVDTSRLKRDILRFRKGFKDKAEQTSIEGFYLVKFPRTCFPPDWIESKVPVVFDFGDIRLQEDSAQDFLYCLLPEKFKGLSIVHRMSRQNFIDKACGLLNVSGCEVVKTFEERFMSKPLDIRRCVETYARHDRLEHCPPDWLV